MKRFRIWRYSTIVLVAFLLLPNETLASLLGKNSVNPSLEYTATNTFDQHQVRYPNVLKVSDQLWMYYFGVASGNHIEIGLATSSDGENWNRYSEDPIYSCGENQLSECTSNYNWSSYRTTHVKVMFDEGIFKMWYLGDAYNVASPYSLGYATSSDGINWVPYSQNPTFPRNPDNGFNSYGLEKLNNTYYLFYLDGNGNTYLATSTDGINWITQNQGNPVSASIVKTLGVFGNKIYATIDKLLYYTEDGINFTKVSDEQIVDENTDDVEGSALIVGDEVWLWKTEVVGKFTWGANNTVINLWKGDAGIFEVNDEPNDIPGWLERLRELIEELELKDADEKRLLKLVDDAEEAYAEENTNKLLGKLKGLLGQLKGLRKSERITAETYYDASAIHQEIKNILVEQYDVPLITQIVSPYPSEEETAAWAGMTYASSTAASSCGTTVAECGCALASMSMIAHSYDVKRGIDESEVNPGNMNEWLVENDGYTSYGAMLWGKVLEYLSRKQGDETVSRLALTSFNETDTGSIDSFLADTGPVVAYNSGLGHFFVLVGKVAGDYFVRDPWWYDTATSDDEKDAGNYVQDHDNNISKANLFTYQKKEKKLARMIEVRLGSPAELRLLDGDGNVVGHDPQGGGVVSEIAKGSYDQHDVITTTGEIPDPHVGKTLMLLAPQDDVYTLEVIGTGTGDYSLTVLTIGDSGNTEVTTLTGSTTPDEVDSFVLDLEAEADIEAFVAEIEALIADWEHSQREFILNKLRVIADKVAKENVTAVDATVAGLLRYVDGIDEAEREAVVELLEELVS